MAHRDIYRAAEAHTDLDIFTAIEKILEGGCIYGNKSHDAAARILKICRAETRRLVVEYDAAVEETRP